MIVKNAWKTVKNRYRLSTKVQMNFELSFPLYLIGRCWITINTACEIRTQKISPSLKGIVFSDTIPLSWFTSSVLIPWEKVMKIDISENLPPIEGVSATPLSSKSSSQSVDREYCTIELNDPRKITIVLPWSKKCTDYIEKNQLIDIPASH